MNKQRRKMLSGALDIIRKSATVVEYGSAKVLIESALDGENMARENRPESFQETDDYCASEEASENMENAIEFLETAISYLNDDEDEESAHQNIFEAIECLENIPGVR